MSLTANLRSHLALCSLLRLRYLHFDQAASSRISQSTSASKTSKSKAIAHVTRYYEVPHVDQSFVS